MSKLPADKLTTMSTEELRALIAEANARVAASEFAEKIASLQKSIAEATSETIVETLSKALADFGGNESKESTKKPKNKLVAVVNGDRYRYEDGKAVKLENPRGPAPSRTFATVDEFTAWATSAQI